MREVLYNCDAKLIPLAVSAVCLFGCNRTTPYSERPLDKGVVASCTLEIDGADPNTPGFVLTSGKTLAVTARIRPSSGVGPERVMSPIVQIIDGNEELSRVLLTSDGVPRDDELTFTGNWQLTAPKGDHVLQVISSAAPAPGTEMPEEISLEPVYRTTVRVE